jgi:hypothetical protein
MIVNWAYTVWLTGAMWVISVRPLTESLAVNFTLDEHSSPGQCLAHIESYRSIYRIKPTVEGSCTHYDRHVMIIVQNHRSTIMLTIELHCTSANKKVQHEQIFTWFQYWKHFCTWIISQLYKQVNSLILLQGSQFCRKFQQSGSSSTE